MKIEYKGTIDEKSKFIDLVEYLENVKKNVWKYMGMNVEIDPTVDFNNQNILVRWIDLNEGFNDKIIIHSLREFKNQFKAS